MKSIFKIITYAVLIASGITIYYFSREPDRNHKLVRQDTKTQIVNNHNDETPPVELNTQGKPNSDQVAINLFESSLDSGKNLKIIEQLLAIGKDDIAKGLLQELHERCAYKDQITAMPTTPPWALERILQYCENYDPSLYQKLSREGIHLGIENPDITSLITSEETDIDQLTEDFLAMLTQMNYPSSHFMADVVNTINHFTHELQVPLNLGQSDDLYINDINKIQTVAVELYTCERFGGCGPGSHQVLNYCFIDNRCQEHWSLMDYYQNTLSPFDFNEMLNVLETIRRYH